MGSSFWAAAAALVCAAAAPVQSYDTYKSWLVACDNTLHCEAKGFNQQGARAELSISRDAGPDGAPHAMIAAEGNFTADDIMLDGQKLAFAPGWERADAGDGGALATDSLQAVRDLVQRIRNGSQLKLPGDDVTIPLDGFAAALLRMDDRQGRVGGETALLNPGPVPASNVPAALPVPVIPAHPITATLQRGEEPKLIAETRRKGADVLRKEQCEDPSVMQPAAYALDASRALVLIPCIQGAYQGSSISFLTGRSDGVVREIRLPLAYLGDDPDHGVINWITEGDFDPATGILSMSAKGRGLADCGTSASWVWDGESFQLIAFTMQRDCGGVEPGDWPVLFRSKQ